MVRLEEYKQRIGGFWQKYRKSKMGITGLVIIIFFLVVALIAPLLSPWDSPVHINVAPRLSAPMWLLPLNPYGFREEYPLSNPNFDPAMKDSSWIHNETSSGEGYITVGNPHFQTNASGWVFSKTGGGSALASGSWLGTTGAPGPTGSGPGCYEVRFKDTSTSVGYGTTNVYLEYAFVFNASKYPPGLVSRHPSRVSIQYSISVLMNNTVQNVADMLFALEITNSSGPAVAIYSRQYFIPTTAVSWSTRSWDMGDANMTSTFTGTDTMTLRLHFTFRDSIDINTPSIIARVDDVQCFIQADYSNVTNSPVTTSEWIGTDGNLNDTTPGCYRFTFQDNSTITSYQGGTFPWFASPPDGTNLAGVILGPTAWIQSSFTWNYYERPNEAYLRYVYKVEVLGDPGDAFINVVTEVYVAKTGYTVAVLRDQNVNANATWNVSPGKTMDSFMLRDSFDERGTLGVRYRVELVDPTPEDTFTFMVSLDDCQIQLLGGYYGLLGAGQYGEDLWAQLLWGSRISMLIGLSAAFISTFVGLIVGLIAGYFGGLVDEVLMRITDFFLVIPGLPLMIVLAAILGQYWWNFVLVIALVGWTGTARLVRSQVLSERQKAYVEAARAIGASDLYIIFRHIFPNVTPLLFAQITLGVAGSILSEAGLSFLGLTNPVDVSWGRMLMQASQSGAYSQGAWWYVFFPGLCIVLLALSFTLVGYAVDEILNPRLRIRKE
jgi:peptide/nickel transport system permease protein